MSDAAGITPSQRGLGDMDPEEFRRAAHRVADLAADYLRDLATYRVLPDLRPGDVHAQLDREPPAAPEPLDSILEDYVRVIAPNVTHWQHPGFMAYFPSVAAGPGILGEWLATTLNSNVMFWRNAPASTELEELAVAWLRGMMGLPPAFDGMFTDTASVSSLLAIVAARHAVPGLAARERGLAGRPEAGRLRLYLSEEAHSSIEKGAIVAGFGRDGVRRIPTDQRCRMRAEALAAAIAEDRASGWVPCCAVATLGTTSSTAVDPADAIADVCSRERVWMHVDAAYGGVAAIAPEYRPLFAGWERADSIVVNPHKWLFTPFDASLLLFRDRDQMRDAFSLVPEYIRTPDTGAIHNFNEYGIQLGRRFRALKVWMHVRWFGVEGIAERLRFHCRLAQRLAGWIDAAPGWERLAPTPLATVCARHVPRELREPEAIDAHNERILEEVNRSGEVFLSHTRLRGRYAIRVSIGNPRQTSTHVERCWELLQSAAARESPG